ncbi:MAG: dihydropteroate synthase [Gammaproteobacteria bacterium]|nr:dihydropteroate synthase [Gammaproteobacteria bacterium]
MWVCGTYVLDCNKPLVMGVVNLHPASFARISYKTSVDDSVAQALSMIEEGAAIIDLGAEPTNPQQASHTTISVQEELARLLPVLRQLVPRVKVPISIDTSQPEVMKVVLSEGASIINDTRALNYEGAVAAVAATKAGVCLMHQGDGSDIKAIAHYLKDRATVCIQAGIAQQRIAVDPGIGNGHFGKTSLQNLALLKQLSALCADEYPVLVGVSRKTFIGDVLGVPPEDRLAGSLAAMIVAYQQGVRIVRVHDVAPTVHALKVIQAIGTA